MRVVVIGLGGIGSALLPHLARYLAYRYTDGNVYIRLVDGDSYEPRNRERQAFSSFGNKAQVWANDLVEDYPDITFEAVPEYVTAENIRWIIEKNAVVFLAVDNHATRKFVSNFSQLLSDIVLISGGNELTDGNVQIYIRKKGRDATLSLTAVHPEIAEAEDMPGPEQACMELVESEPQLLFMNLGIAWAMLIAFWALEQGRLNYGEVFLDILQGKMQPYERWTKPRETQQKITPRGLTAQV